VLNPTLQTAIVARVNAAKDNKRLRTAHFELAEADQWITSVMPRETSFTLRYILSIFLSMGLRRVLLSGFPKTSLFLYRVTSLLRYLRFKGALMGEGLPANQPTLKRSSFSKRTLIVSPDTSEMPPFGPAQGNYFFEIYRAGLDYLPPNTIQNFKFNSKLSFFENCTKIVSELELGGFTHLVLPLEYYPRAKGGKQGKPTWQWDLLALTLKSVGSQVSVVIYAADGVYELHQLYCKAFQRIYKRSVFLFIDIPPESKYIKERFLSGPSFFPVSRGTIGELSKFFAKFDQSRPHLLSFVGRIYNPRGLHLRALEEIGVHVAINPHQSLLQEYPSQYFAYMDVLRRSKFTMSYAESDRNFAPQVKSRMLEALLMGCTPISNDRALNALLLIEGRDFRYCTSPEQVFEVLSGTPSNGEIGIGFGGQEIRKLAEEHFWSTIQKVLTKADLPTL
jgi:hypothetical protein